MKLFRKLFKRVPNTLDQALEMIIKGNKKEDFSEWSKLKEDKAVSQLHFTLGMAIRNHWGLWEGKNELVKFFHYIGITHPDDMSSIIHTSLHRKLNNKDIDLWGQVKHYQAYWKKHGYKDGIPK